MQLEEYFEFLEPNDIRLKGHRIGIESILYEYLHHDKTPEEIADRFPTLTLEQVYATILYYLHNQETIHTYMTMWIEHGRRMRAEQVASPSPSRLKMRQARAERENQESALARQAP